MSTHDAPLPIDSAPLVAHEAPLAIADDASRWQAFARRVAAKVESAGEWLNPLLVKEVRQALKSRQFSFWFALVLIAAWVWSIADVVYIGPGIAFGANGPDLFYGYYLILATPLLLIVPFAAFRSLTAEREDNTYELVAITALKPRQIVGGKLGSAVAQMLVYFSAIAPCLAFTYLLRGIDVLTIGWILFYTFLASLGFSLCALLFATVAKERHWQIVYSVLIIIGLFLALYAAVGWCHDLLRSPRMPFHEPGFWLANLTFLTAYASVFALFYLAAGAQLTFTAENRSTPLRIVMLVQQMLLAGWLAFYVARVPGRGETYLVIMRAAILYAGFSTFYWFVMGSIMVGELPELSPRVKRGLPKSGLGRILFTWFNPGPGTGYLFAITNASAAVIFAALAITFSFASPLTLRGGLPISPMTMAPMDQLYAFLALLIAYLIIYLGLGHLLIRALRRVSSQVTLATSFLVTGLLLFAGWGIPWVIAETMRPRPHGYTLLHITDPFSTCGEVLDRSAAAFSQFDILWRVLPAAATVLLVNLVYIIPEVRHVRITPPKRVEEDTALAATAAPLKPISPWD
jgi:hypothetical protein